MAKRTGRQKSQLPPCYYEGYLEKRSFKDKTSRKLWACLCGNTLFFFNDKRDNNYVEKVELSGFLSITDDNSQDRNLDAARLNLQMKDGIIKFNAPTTEARELWKGYIHSVAELSVPTSLNLLPGQIHMLREAVEEEKQRIKSSPPPSNRDSDTYVCLKPDMPSCYHNVSRLEAELLLEREAKKGNLLLRPGRDGSSFAVTTRQDLAGPVFRHYRVARKQEGFSIDVDNPVSCSTLHDVINYLVQKSEGALIPLNMEGTYDRRIYKENGEKSVQQAPPNNEPPSLPPKPAPKTSIPEPAPKRVEGNIYLNDMLEEMEKGTEESPEVPLPPLRRAIMPPAIAPRKWSSTASTPSSTKDPITKILSETPGQIPLAALSELKLKLEQKAKSVE